MVDYLSPRLRSLYTTPCERVPRIIKKKLGQLRLLTKVRADRQSER